MKLRRIFVLAFCVFCMGCSQRSEDKVQVVMIDGIKHIQNPAEPIKGTISLELEKQLEINPYEHEEVGMGGFKSAKIMNGDVILYDRSEAHRFNKEGNYLGSIFEWGQGPGEIGNRNLVKVHYMDNQIWAKAPRKLLKFNGKGEFIEEIKLKNFAAIFIDTEHYITSVRTWEKNVSLDQVVLTRFTESMDPLENPVYIEGSNLGLIKTGEHTGYGEQWGTPDLEYNADIATKRIYVGMKMVYKIQVKDIEGNILYIMEKPHIRIKLSRKDKEKILDWIRPNNLNRDVNAYPDELLSFRNIEVLPRGYIAVFRISGIREFTVDIFDNEGRFVYAIDPSANPMLDFATFYSFGIATIEYRGDFPVYVEYRVKNLPEIFDSK